MTLHILIGLPRSGKSTYARSLLRELPRSAIVCPDEIRLALHGQPYSPEAEPFVWAIAQIMARALFKSGHEHVILDATNLTHARREEWAWCKRVFYEILTPVEECKRRAIACARGDLIAVIDRMEAAREPLSLKTGDQQVFGVAFDPRKI